MLKLLTNPYALLAGGLLLIAALAGAYFQGRADGRSIVAAKYLKRDLQTVKQIEIGRKAIDRIGGSYASARTSQETATREIFHESIRVIEKPVYHVTCGDADAGRLFDHARTTANRGLASLPAFTPARASSNAP